MIVRIWRETMHPIQQTLLSDLNGTGNALFHTGRQTSGQDRKRIHKNRSRSQFNIHHIWWHRKESAMLKDKHAVQAAMPGVPAGGLRTVGQIRGTNDLIFHVGQNGMTVALELLASHTPGAPVVDAQNKFVGFISEFDVLRALEADKDLAALTAEHIMVQERISVTPATTLKAAVRLMEEKRLLNLPVVEDGKVAYSITRHDLLRAWVGLGTTGED